VSALDINDESSATNLVEARHAMPLQNGAEDVSRVYWSFVEVDPYTRPLLFKKKDAPLTARTSLFIPDFFIGTNRHYLYLEPPVKKKHVHWFYGSSPRVWGTYF